MQGTDGADEQSILCMRMLGNGEYERSLEYARRANAAGYLGPEPDYARSLIHLRRGQHDSAELYAKRAIERDYRYVGGYEVLASAQAHLYKWDSLEAVCRYALTLSPTSTVLRYYLDQAELGQVASSRSMLVVVVFLVLFVFGFWRHWNSSTNPYHWPLATTLAIGGAVSGALYSSFYLMSSLIWSLNTQLPFSEILSPAVASAYERDGIEGYVLFAMTLVNVGLSVLTFNLLRQIEHRLALRSILAIVAVASVWYLLSVGFFPPEISVAPDVSKLVGVCTGVLFVAGSLVMSLDRYPRLTSAALLIALLPVSFIAIEPISMFDYSFILAPALRILQGVNLSEIYMQYDLLLSLVCAIWFKLGGGLNRIELIGQASMYVFYVASFFLARRYFLDRRLAALFIVSLLVVRSYANHHEPAALLQVTSLRLDMWLLLLFLAFYRGVWHWSVGLSLGILIMIHRNFGLLYLAAYMCMSLMLLISAIHQVTRSDGFSFAVVRQQTWLWMQQVRINAALVALFAAFTYVVYGGVGAESAIMYQRLGLGMMMIPKNSFYWLVPVVFSSVAILLWQLRSRLTERYFETSLFLVFLAIGNSMYYFGRSHENNIVNIAGILLFVVYILFDLYQQNLLTSGERTGVIEAAKGWKRLVGYRNAALTMAVALLLGVSYFYSQKIHSRMSVQLHGLKTNRWAAPVSANDVDLASVNAIVSDPSKVYVMDQQRDFLYHYKGGFPLVGYFNPYAAWVVKSNFVAFADSLLRVGYSVVVPSFEQMLEVIPDLNYNVVRESNGVYALGQVETSTLLPRGSSKAIHISFPAKTIVRSVYRKLDLDSGSFTFEVLVDPVAAKSTQTIVFGAVDDGNRGVVLETTGSSEGSCRVLLLNGSQFEALPQIMLEPGQLNHFTVSGDSRTLNVYRNGMPMFSGPQPRMLRQNRATLVVGAPYGRAGGTPGLIREFKASSEALTARK